MADYFAFLIRSEVNLHSILALNPVEYSALDFAFVCHRIQHSRSGRQPHF